VASADNFSRSVASLTKVKERSFRDIKKQGASFRNGGAFQHNPHIRTLTKLTITSKYWYIDDYVI